MRVVPKSKIFIELYPDRTFRYFSTKDCGHKIPETYKGNKDGKFTGKVNIIDMLPKLFISKAVTFLEC